MANIEPRANSTFRARIRRNGAPALSRTFSTEHDAQQWADETEAAVRGGRLHEHRQRTTTLRELLEAYGARVTPGKKGHRQELGRILALQRDPIASFSLENLSRGRLSRVPRPQAEG